MPHVYAHLLESACDMNRAVNPVLIKDINTCNEAVALGLEPLKAPIFGSWDHTSGHVGTERARLLAAACAVGQQMKPLSHQKLAETMNCKLVMASAFAMFGIRVVLILLMPSVGSILCF